MFGTRAERAHDGGWSMLVRNVRAMGTGEIQMSKKARSCHMSIEFCVLFYSVLYRTVLYVIAAQRLYFSNFWIIFKRYAWLPRCHISIPFRFLLCCFTYEQTTTAHTRMFFWIFVNWSYVCRLTLNNRETGKRANSVTKKFFFVEKSQNKMTIFVGTQNTHTSATLSIMQPNSHPFISIRLCINK